MSNILKGILNETSPHNYDSDWDYQDAVARSGKSRSIYRSQEDDTFDADVAYSKKMYQLAQKQKRDADHDRLATGTNEGVRDLDYDAQSLIMKLRRDVEEKRLQPTRQAILAAARELAGDMNFAPELLVQQVLSKGVSEGVDDPWGDQGNFAGDKPVNVGSVSMKNIHTGDTVKYLGQSSKVVAMSKDRKYSRITISKGMGTVTQDVLTSDLQQLGQGKAIEENDNIQTRMRMNDYYDLADAIQEKLRQAIKLGNNELVHELSKERADLDARVKKYGLIPESEQLDELDTKLGLYKIAAGKDATAADKAGDYKRGHKRFKGIMKATEKEFANDARKKKDADEKKSAISQGINEYTTAGGPNGPKGPTVGPKGPKGPKDYGQPNSSRYIGKNKFVVGTTLNYILTATVDKWGLEWDDDDEIWFLDSSESIDIADASEGEIELPDSVTQALTPGNIHDLVSDYLNSRNSADLQKVAAYFGHSPDGEMATNEAISNQANRFNSKQEVINHFVKNGKSAAAGAAAWERGYRGSSKKPLELKKPPQRSYHDELDDKRYASIDENLGDQLKSTSLDALVQAKLAIEKQRQAEIDAWSQDFQKNTVQKAQQGLRRELQPTPVAQPGEKHSVLKARLAQLNSAIQKQELLDKLVDRLERRGILTPAMQNDADTTMHVRYGSKDNYESLNKKLDNAIQTLQSRLNIRKISGLKEVHDERDEYDNPRQGRDYGKGNLFIDPGSTEFPKEKHPSDPNVERGRPKHVKGVSKSLPADAFGRTTGKIPAGKRGTVHSKMGNTDEVDEGWSQKYKSSINCSHPKGFSQKAHCAGKKKHNESIDTIMEMTCPDCGMCETHGDNSKDQLDELKYWSGYHRVAGTKAGFPGSCKKNKTNEEQIDEADMNRRGFLKGAGVAAAGIAGVGLGVGAASGASKPIEIEGRWHYKLMQFKPEYATKAEIKKSPDGTKVYTWKRPNLKNPGTFNYYYYPITEEGLAEEQLNELDFFAPVTTFIKMTDGSYIQADWRKSQGNPGLSDSASFVNFKPVNPNVAKQLGLDSYQRNNSISNHRDGTIVPGGPIQGSGPLANRGYEVVDYNKPETMKELPPEIKSELIKWVQTQSVVEESCPHCGGEMVSEELMNEKKDACYYKVKSRYKVWPSAYASGALVKCRNKGASNWGNGGKKNESSILEGINRADESLHDWFNKEKWVRMDTKGNIKGPCAKEPGEGKPKCLPQSKAHSLGKKGRASAAQRKRREDPNPERSGKAINVDTKKSKG